MIEEMKFSAVCYHHRPQFRPSSLICGAFLFDCWAKLVPNEPSIVKSLTAERRYFCCLRWTAMTKACYLSEFLTRIWLYFNYGPHKVLCVSGGGRPRWIWSLCCGAEVGWASGNSL